METDHFTFLVVGFFFPYPTPRPLLHFLLTNRKEPNLESFQLVFGALIFFRGKENTY